MENNNQKDEKLLQDLTKELEEKDKIIWKSMWVIMAISIVALIGGLCVCVFFIPKGVWQLVAIISLCIVFLIPCFYALKLEVNVGGYKCKKCGCDVVPTYKQVLLSMHLGTTRYLKCPNCNKHTWCKKSIKK